MDMEDTQRMGIREIRARFGDRVAAAYYANEPTIVTKNERPQAVLIPYAWYEELMRLRGTPPPGPEAKTQTINT